MNEINYTLQTHGLTKKYGDTIVVDHVNMHIPTGKIYGLLGRNGAGKSTTMKMLLQLIPVTKGSIELFGKDYLNTSLYKRIGSLIEAPGFYPNLTAYDNLKLLARLHEGTQHDKHNKHKINSDSNNNNNNEKVIQALKIVNLETETKKTFAQFSLGMKQRLGIAAAILHEPELLILDEPINGLDPIGIAMIREFLLHLSHDLGVTILISSHVLSEIEQLADVIGVMNYGQLIEEVDISKLHNQLKQSIQLTVTDPDAADAVLKQFKLISEHRLQYSINQNTICITKQQEPPEISCHSGYNNTPDTDTAILPNIEGDLNKHLIDNEIKVTSLVRTEEKLEDYFESLIGGGTIA